MVGESGLYKSETKNVNSYIVADVNDAMRKMYLSRALIVVAGALSGAYAAGTSSEIYELPGRNNFIVQIEAAAGTPSGFDVHLQGSILPNSGLWADIASVNSLGYSSYTDNRPFRFYRLLIVNAPNNANARINAHLSAIAY